MDAPAEHAQPSRWNLHRALVAAGALCTLLATLAFASYDLGNWVQALPEFVPALPGLVFTGVLLWKARPWAYLTAGLLNAVLPLMVLFVFGAFAALAEPALGVEYQSLVFLVLALVLSLTGGIGGFMDARQGRTTPLAGALGTRTGLAMGVVAILAVGVLLTSTAATGQLRDATAAGAAFDVTPDEVVQLDIREFAFSPAELTIPAGKLVRIDITNHDGTMHTFTYALPDGRSLDATLAGHAATSVLVKIDEPGKYKFWCTPHSDGAESTTPDEHMMGYLHVA